MEIKRQWELGDAGLLEEDKYLAEVNLGGLENTLGECLRTTGYWPSKLRRKQKILWEQQERQQTVSGETM